jgi:hypothetical protein
MRPVGEGSTHRFPASSDQASFGSAGPSSLPQAANADSTTAMALSPRGPQHREGDAPRLRGRLPLLALPQGPGNARSPGAVDGHAASASRPASVVPPASAAAGPSSTARATIEAPLAAALQLHHAAIAAVRGMADEVGALEAALAALKQPPAQPVAEAEIPKADREKAIRRLQASLERAQSQCAELGAQRDRAGEGVERLDAVLQQKTALLEQQRRELEEGGRSTAAPARAETSSRERRADARAEAATRVDTLTRQLNETRVSRQKAAREAVAVAGRDRLRELGAGTYKNLVANSIGGFKPEGVRREQMEIITQWLQPVARRSERSRVNLGETVQSAQTAAFEHLARSANDPDGNAQEALQVFLSMTARHDLKGLHTVVEQKLVTYLEGCLIAADGTPRVSRAGAMVDALCSLAERRAREGIFTGMLDTIKETSDMLRKVVGKGGKGPVKVGEQLLKKLQVPRALRQCESLAVALEDHREDFLIILERVGDTFLKVQEDDDIEKMGRVIAPELDAYYQQQTAKLSAELAQQEKVMQHGTSSAAAKARPADTAEASAATHAQQSEIRILRLQGEIQQSMAQRRRESKQYTDLSARHNRAREEANALARQMQAQQGALQAQQRERRDALRQRSSQDAEAGQIEQKLTALWGRIRHEPALARLVSTAALDRAEHVHVGQSIEQMRSRMDSNVNRTGTYSSRSSLLRVVADVANHDLGKREPVLLTQTLEDFERITANDPARSRGLCSHGRTVGHGMRQSRRRPEEARTGTTQYDLGWVADHGPRITHMHPWISPD